MTQASLAHLEEFKRDLLKRISSHPTCGDFAESIDIILNLFDQVEEELVMLSECIDDLAKHTGYQLKEKANEPTNG